VASFHPFPNVPLAATKQTYKCVIISSHFSSRASKYRMFSITFLKQGVNFGIHAL